MIKVKALSLFTDKKADETRIKGDVFNVTAKRFKEINSTAHGELVVEVEENNTDMELEKA